MGRQLENTNIKFLVIEYYQIFYKFSEDEIKVLHVWDSRRNPDDFIIKG